VQQQQQEAHMRPPQAQVQRQMQDGLLGGCRSRRQAAVPLPLLPMRLLALLLLVRQQRVLQLLRRKARKH
jgi:hypothetical protein